ncbi:acyl-CoA thioesterase [Ruminiclostridium sufflavum DSM 19573]|uniref:Acyl-CoA thioesterase n=1 Tax=Ruminiclostridium sufflavum DSM 19573 TaxID=1121337 RepID=A0A318XPE6_9FIRM|nr:PaaI family thioesterase [Ruminiclostridium sufflavum]PYG87549.1 acyl-CoA thioesterase [Ruminiclostridium sufflavum DSM 19573]
MEKDIIVFFEKDRFAHYVGIELIKVEPGFAVTQLKLSDRHLNGLGIVQGGAIYTLADFAFAAATNSGGLATVGINCSITYFSSPKGSIITAQAKETSSEKRICGCDVEVLDEDGKLIAKFSGTGYRINKTIDYKTGTVE